MQQYSRAKAPSDDRSSERGCDEDDDARAVVATDPFFAGFQKLPAYGGRGKVIRGADHADIFEAQRALAKTRELARDLEHKVLEAVEAGHAQGLDDGRREAAEEFAGHLARVEREMMDFYQDAEATIVDLAVRVAETIIGAVDQKQATAMATRRAILANLDQQPFALHVAPDAEADVLEVVAELRVQHPGARLPVAKVDKRLPSGRALMMTRNGSVELDIASQLRVIRESLKSRSDASAGVGMAPPELGTPHGPVAPDLSLSGAPGMGPA